MARNKNFDEEAILDKAIAIFRRQGYKGTTPEELIEYLGISRSSLYSTFGNKQSLFIKSLQRYRKLTTDALNQLADSSTDSLQGIKAVFKLTTDGCFEDEMPKGCFLVNSIVEFGADDEETTRIVKESMADNREVLLNLVKSGQHNGLVNNAIQANILADYLVNCLSGISISAKAGVDKTSCEAIAENSLKILA